MITLSVVQATRNEEKHIGDNLKSVKDLADELIVVDENSQDKTREIAQSFGAKVFLEPHHEIFHVTKQKALDKATGTWILQLDTDERVTPELAQEIKKVIAMTDVQIQGYQEKLINKRLFLRPHKLLEKRDGKIGTEDREYTGFFVPRKNYFLGKFLKYGGTYPDGVIRLVKKGKAYFPQKSVHEQIVIKGKVGWLENDLLHYDSQNFRRYLERNSYYIDLIVLEMKRDKLRKNITNTLNYMFIKPIYWFLLTQIRHKGILDGWQGVMFSFFSALRFPRAYLRYSEAN